MPVFGRRSREQLDTCHKVLQLIAEEVIKYYDFTVLEGWRSQARQDFLVRKGLSQVRWPKGKHNARTPEGEPESRAIDTAPWPIDWDKTQRFVYLAGWFMAVGTLLLEMWQHNPPFDENGEPIDVDFELRWGGDWDRDTIPVYDDETEHFPDYGHFELVRPA